MTEKIYHLGIKALIRNEEGKILLLKGNQAKFKDVHWDIPGGRVLNGQTIEETLTREIEEETGITTLVAADHLDTVISNIEISLEDGEKVGLVLSIYDCWIEGAVDIQLSDEHTEFTWLSPPEAAVLLSCKYPASFTEKIKGV